MATYAEYREAQEKLDSALYVDEARKIVYAYRLTALLRLTDYIKSGESLLGEIKVYDPATGDIADAYRLTFGREIKAQSDGYVTFWLDPMEEGKDSFNSYVPLAVLEGV